MEDLDPNNPEHRKRLMKKYDPEDDKPKLLEIRRVTGISRDEWGAVLSKGKLDVMQLPVLCAIISYTGTRHCSTKEECTRQVRKLQRKHMMKGYPDIKYSFLIGGDGHVYEGRGWDFYPEKNKKYPKFLGNSIEIGLLTRKANYISRADAEKEANMHVLERIHRQKERKLNCRPAPELMHLAMDLLELGWKKKYLAQHSLILNSE